MHFEISVFLLVAKAKADLGLSGGRLVGQVWGAGGASRTVAVEAMRTRSVRPTLAVDRAVCVAERCGVWEKGAAKGDCRARSTDGERKRGGCGR